MTIESMGNGFSFFVVYINIVNYIETELSLSKG